MEREITAAQLNGLRIEELRRELLRNRERWRGTREAEPLLQLSGVLLEQLDTTQRATIRELTRLGADQQAHRNLVAEFGEFLSDQLFWRSSSPPVDARFFQALVPSVASLVSPASWQEIGDTLIGISERRTHSIGLMVILLAVLMASRRHLRRLIAERTRRTRRISTDRLNHTLLGLLATLALTLPIPLLLGAMSLGLASDPDAGHWVRGTARWMG